MGTKRFKSVKVFNDELNKTIELIQGILISSATLEKVILSRQLTKENIAHEVGLKSTALLDFTEEKENDIYELGFIRVFAVFESFMYDLLIEIYKKYPNSIPYERKIEVSEIINFNSKKSVIDFVIDQIAVENSYDVNIWEKTLNKSFNIYPFKDQEEKKNFMVLNVIRNMVLHSGRKMNSKAFKDTIKHMINFTKENVNQEKFVVEKFDVPMFEVWKASCSVTYRVVKNIKNHFAK